MSEQSPDPSHRPSEEPPRASDPGVTADDDLLMALADDFASRARRGEHPTVEEYVAKHPAHAERIRKIFPAIAVIEQTRPADPAAIGEGPGNTIGRYKLLERIGEGGFGVVYMAEQHLPVRRRVALKVLKPGMDSRQVLARFEAERQALAIMDHPNIAKVFDGGMTESGRPYFVMELVKGVPITEFCDQHHLTPRQRLELFGHVCHAVQHAHQKGIIHRDIKPTNVLVIVHDTTPMVKVIDFGVAKALGQELTDKTLFTGFAQLLGTPLYMSPEQAGQSALDVDTRSDIYSLGVLLYELLTGTTPFDKERFKQAANDEIRRIIREEEPPTPSTRLSQSKNSLGSISAQRQTEPAKLTRLVRGELDWIVMKALEKDRNRRYETANGFAMDVQRYLADEPVLACPPSAAYCFRKFVRRNKSAVAVVSLVLLFLMLVGIVIGWVVRDRSARRARVGAHVEQILKEVDELQEQQKWPDGLAAARRAEAAVAGGEADAATIQRVRDQLKDLEFIDRLEQARMPQIVWLGGSFDFAGTDRAFAQAFREYGVDVDELPVETSIERLKTRPKSVIPLAAALDEWHSARWSSKRDGADWKRLVAVARGIDPQPVRDRIRATFGRPRPEIEGELRRLADAIDVRGHEPTTLARLAKDLQRAGHSAAAIQLLRDAQRVHPGDFWLNFDLGFNLANRNDHEGAVRFYTAAVAIRPQAVEVLKYLGRSLREQEKLDEAMSIFRAATVECRKAIELDPNCADHYVDLGTIFMEQEQPDDAIAAYRKAIELDPEHFKAYNVLGMVLAGQGQLEEAIGAYRRAIELKPTYAYAYNQLGRALADHGKLDEATSVFRKAIEIIPAYSFAHYNLGRALRRQGKLEDAVAAFRRAIELAPEHADSHRALGLVLRAQKNSDEAITAFRKAIELDPKLDRAYVDLGAFLSDEKKDYAAAVECFRKAIELDPKYAEAHSGLASEADAQGGLANALACQGKFEEAIATYEGALAANPDLHSNQHSFAWLLATCPNAKLRAPARAVTLAKKAIELASGNARYFNTLGIAEYRAGDWQAAIDALNNSVALRRGGGDAYDLFFLAMAHWQLGDQAEAPRWYDRAVEWMEKNGPDDPDLIRFSAEAAELLGMNPNEQRPPSTAPATATSQKTKV